MVTPKTVVVHAIWEYNVQGLTWVLNMYIDTVSLHHSNKHNDTRFVQALGAMYHGALHDINIAGQYFML